METICRDNIFLKKKKQLKGKIIFLADMTRNVDVV